MMRHGISVAGHSGMGRPPADSTDEHVTAAAAAGPLITPER